MVLKWSKKQLEMLARMKIPFDATQELSDDELEQLYEIVPDYLEFDGNGEPKGDCLTVEDMIDVVGREMEKRGLFE